MSPALSFRRWAVIAAAALSGVLVLISMFVDPAPNADGRELIRAYAENETAQGIHTNLIHYGFALFAPVAFALVGLVRGRGAWLANVAGILAVVGLTTLPGLVLLDYANVGAAHVTDVETAFAVQEETEKLPGFLVLLVPAFLSSMVALPLAALAAWRAGLVPWWTPIAAAGAFLLPNVVPEALVGFALMALGMLLVAWALARIPPPVWHGVAPVEPAARA